MRITSANTTAVFAAATVAFAAGCSGGSSPITRPASNSSSATSAIRPAQFNAGGQLGDRTGISPKFLKNLHIGFARQAQLPPINSPYKELAVSDFGTGGVEILGQAFHVKGTLTTGLSAPDGDWIDASKNLYVADYIGVNVQEYAAGSTSPTFTYSAGLTDPINVTTDYKGHVYVTDYTTNLVVEYAQGVNTVVNECPLAGGAEGVAADSAGNVFVSYNNIQKGGANITEFKGGLARCNGTVLPPTLGFAGGLQIANDGSLVAADQNVGVDIIPKPYTAIASTITGALDSFHISLTKFNHLLFIADPASADILVVNYPSGTLSTTLNVANGITQPGGVAAYEIGQEWYVASSTRRGAPNTVHLCQAMRSLE